PDEMLERRDDALRLQALDVRGADLTDDVRVLRDALLDPPPPGVAHDVEHGGEPLVHAELAHRGADLGSHLLDELGVEARAPRGGYGVGGRLPRGEPVEALLVRDRGDADRLDEL